MIPDQVDVNTKAWWQDLSDKGKDNAMYKNSIVQMNQEKRYLVLYNSFHTNLF